MLLILSISIQLQSLSSIFQTNKKNIEHLNSMESPYILLSQLFLCIIVLNDRGITALGDLWSRWRGYGRCYMVLGLSAQSTVLSRNLTMYFLQRIQRGHPTARPKGRGVGCLFWVLSLSLSEISLASFSCCFQYHVIFDRDISMVYSIHVFVFCV